jgi:hypothetical protein
MNKFFGYVHVGVISFVAGFWIAVIDYHRVTPHIIKPALTASGPYSADDPTIVNWYECDPHDSEILPPMWPPDVGERDGERQKKYNDAVRCLVAGKP